MHLKKSSAVMLMSLSMAIAQVACKDLEKAADTISIATAALDVAKDTVKTVIIPQKEQDLKDAFAKGVLTKEQANAQWADFQKDLVVVADINLKVAQGTLEAATYIKSLAELDAAERLKIVNMISPLLDRFKSAIDTDLVKINDPKLKAVILTSLTKAKEALDIVLLIMEGA